MYFLHQDGEIVSCTNTYTEAKKEAREQFATDEEPVMITGHGIRCYVTPSKILHATTR